MTHYRTRWWTLIAVLAVTFVLLGFFGTEVYRNAPPIPDQAVAEDGEGLNTTPVHAHAALFGVYGFLRMPASGGPALPTPGIASMGPVQ
mgnify:CR=1 FL=1